MDANNIVDIPDTPERVGRPKRDGQERCSRVSSSKDSRMMGEDSLSMTAGKNDSSSQNEGGWRSVHHRKDINISEPTGNGRSSAISVHRPSSALVHAPLFRKVGNNSLKPDATYPVNSQHVENKRSVHLKCSSKPVNHPEHNMGKCMIGGNTDRLQKSLPQCVQIEGKASKSNAVPLGSSSLYSSDVPSKGKSYLNKGKEKINEDLNKAIPSASDRGKCSLLTKNDGSELKLPPTSSRKRLVRNGCISPLNVAKAKQAAESSTNHNCDFKSASTNEMEKVSPSIVINLDGDLSGGRRSNLVKGKGIVSHPLSSEEYDTKMRYMTQSLASKTDPSMEQKHQANISKRQKREDPPLSSQHRDEEIVCIGSRSKPSSSGSHTELTRRRPRALNDVIDIDEHSPKIESSNSQNDNDSEARAMQLEADEILARELQEQLYHETPTSGSTESDSHLAWMLQREANVQRAPRSGNVVIPRASSSSQPRRPFRSHLLRDRYRSSAQAQAPTSRLGRLRTTMQRATRLFPSEMDLETRIELLEALEAVVSDDMTMVNQLLNSDREFTEDDYDMLLALDENNHEHLGASNTQIFNLPESIVQTNTSETCSICLDEPAIGETIRHLPCLHKFHKDCIDQWLRRKRSCPVCKSEIT